MPAARPLALALLATTFAASGCAAASKDSAKDFTGESRAVATTVEDFQDAARKGDEDRICGKLLATALVRRIEAAGKGGTGTCATALHESLRDADQFELQVKKVNVTGTTATAIVRSEGGHTPHDSTLQLVKQGTPAGWKISAIG